MSVSMDMIVEMLPLSSKLQQSDNPLRIVLDRTVGEWLDNFSQPYEQLFLMSATGGWLDAHGRDYGVPRRLDEDDESYRQRIVYEKLDHLTPALLSDVYGVQLFTYRGDFNVSNNTLVSDNPHIVMNESFLGTSDEDTISILDKKFVLDSIVTWINDIGEIEYLLDTRGKNILSNYSKIYTSQNIYNLFKNNDSIQKVKLDLPVANECSFLFNKCSSLESVNLSLPNASSCRSMFYSCSNLIDVDLQLPTVTNCLYMFDSCSSLSNIDLTLPNATNCNYMFIYCTNLVNVKLNLPKINSYTQMFNATGNIETIDVTIPTSQVNGFKAMVDGATPRLTKLTSFKINGEEQI